MVFVVRCFHLNIAVVLLSAGTELQAAEQRCTLIAERQHCLQLLAETSHLRN
jgi:hypothetical protein